MLQARGYAATNARTPLAPFAFERREPGPKDVLIEIDYCGICHSDIHQARDEWGGSMFPMVPGHEIVGRVTRVGEAVTRFAPGDLAGIGCFVDSCRTCPSCQAGVEQYCYDRMVQTYNSFEKDGVTPTYGGYSNAIVADEDYVLRIPGNLDLAATAPLLCAGVTTWSPLRHWGIGEGHQVGIIGLGGLGHMAVKLAVSFGAEVTVLSHSPGKKEDALRLGAHNFVATREEGALEKFSHHFDFLLSTISAAYDPTPYFHTLGVDGTMVTVGVPSEPLPVHLFPLILRRRSLAGSVIGGIRETQEMLDYCGEKGIVSDIELIPYSYLNEAYERVLKSDVRYRFVLDAKTL